MESESYGEQTWEYLTVVSGEIELILDDQSFHVEKGKLTLLLHVTENMYTAMPVKRKRYAI